MKPTVQYPIYETFMTFQGEGLWMGWPAFFVRSYGCPIHCPWCDSAGTWHKDYVPDHIQRVTPEAIILAARMGPCSDMVVITGGEPAIFDWIPVTELAHAHSIRIHLETSGAFLIKGDFDWVTVSPKKWHPPLLDSVKRANEFKLIIEEPEDIELYSLLIERRGRSVIWLHPEWSQRTNPEVLNAISTAVKNGRGLYRAGWQIHKCYAVDTLDVNSKPLVPLGGDPKKGI